LRLFVVEQWLSWGREPSGNAVARARHQSTGYAVHKVISWQAPDPRQGVMASTYLPRFACSDMGEMGLICA